VAKPAPSNNAEKPDPKGGLLPGRIVDNRYEVICLVGAGGMGAVYRVKHLVLLKDLALKTLLSRNLSKQALRRFRQEAKAASALNHKGLIKVSDFGLTEQGQPYMVMEFVEGGSLADAIEKVGQLYLGRVLNIFDQVSDALAHAHEKGIIHRDLKPSNILLEPGPGGVENAKIVDFGVAKMLEDDSGAGLRLTQTGEVLGSPLYMSPEQCAGGRADQRSDIYSLGCAMFEALTGCPPLQGETALATMLKHQQEKPPTLTEGSFGQSFPAELEEVVARMLAKDPTKRYQTMREVNEALKLVIGTGPGDRKRAQVSQSPESNERNRGKGLTVPVFITLSLLSVIVSSAATIICLNWNSYATPASPPAKEVEFIGFRPPVSDDAKSRVSEEVQSTRDGKERIIHFPDKFSMGGLYTHRSPYAQLKPYGQAQGIKRFPLADLIELRPSWIVCEAPQLFDGFQSDDLHEINFQNVPPLDDNVLKHVAKLKDLHELNLTSTNITDAGISYLLTMPKLEDLQLSSTEISGAGIYSLKKMKSLRALSLNNLTLDKRAFDYLRSGPPLSSLELRSCGLVDKDLEALSNLKSLISVRLQGNKGIRGEGLKYLASDPNLEMIDLRDIALDPDCFRYLKEIPKLYGISVSRKYLDARYIARFRHELWHTTVYLDADPPKNEEEIMRNAGI
jgi:serine/threonine-protein kinase